MKIGLVCPYNMFERAGGVQQVVQHLHDGLTKKGHTVKIITQRPSGFKGSVPDDYILLGITRDFKGGFGVAGNWGMPVNGEEIEQALDREKFDVINFHEPWVPILAWSMLPYSAAAHVGTFHANLIDNIAAKSWPRIFTPYARGIGAKMHLLTAVSPAPASLLISKASKKWEDDLIRNIRYIPNGVDLKLYKPFKKRQPLSGPNTKTVVYVGRLDRRKGIHWLLRAFAQLQADMPNLHLIVAGEGSYRTRLLEIVKTEKIHNAQFVGYVTDEEKRRLLGNADVVCAPALYGESFGIVLLEAMAMGAPLLAGNNLGYINIMTGHGRIGLIDPKATVDFANRLNVFLTDEGLRKFLRQWNLTEVKKYDYPKIVDQYEAAYGEALVKWRLERHLNGGNGKHVRFWQIRRRLALRRQS
ncbi:MAG: Glycosyl transferase, group 1 family protein [Candidatus Saccharibacteria bacterium GW2011_GWA2_46_10]|nr:MAG: Glycosyl transferase, group 1 family protein [Candidatus Saccharibacteria bacterium GW2011_GWA2_46_10]